MRSIPKAETYIMQGEVLPLDGPQARAAHELDHGRSHRYALMAQKPKVCYRRRRALCGLGKGISDIDDLGRDGPETEAWGDARSALAYGCQ